MVCVANIVVKRISGKIILFIWCIPVGVYLNLTVYISTVIHKTYI